LVIIKNHEQKYKTKKFEAFLTVMVKAPPPILFSNSGHPNTDPNFWRFHGETRAFFLVDLGFKKLNVALFMKVLQFLTMQ